MHARDESYFHKPVLIRCRRQRSIDRCELTLQVPRRTSIVTESTKFYFERVYVIPYLWRIVYAKR